MSRAARTLALLLPALAAGACQRLTHAGAETPDDGAPAAIEAGADAATRGGAPPGGAASATSHISASLGADALRRVLALSPLPAPPDDPTNRVDADARAARLGQRLFFDAGLSADGTISCATCHVPTLAFTDGRPVAVGIDEQEGTRNTPTTLNVAHNRWLFWDGRADSVWAQAIGPIENPIEMGGSRLGVAQRVADDAALAAAYEELFGPLPDLAGLPAHARPVAGDPDHPHALAWDALPPATRDAIDRLMSNVAKAIAAYERRLVSGRSRFDVFAEGVRTGNPTQQAALSPSEQRGLSIFLGRGGCRRCHFGPLLTDGEFHNTGAPPTAAAGADDPGRYGGVPIVQADPFNAHGRHSDDPDGPAALLLETLRASPETWGEFKTPSLRNVGATPPYMHAGQLPDLHAVVRFYSTLENALGVNHHGETTLVPFELTDAEADDLVAFLHTLTDTDQDPELLWPLEQP